MKAQFDDYVLGNSSEEYKRLRMQALAWEEATIRVLGKAGVKLGDNCLDVGSGPGEVMRLLREIVGHKGQVTGIDKDGKIGREALAALTTAYGNNIAFYELDAASAAAIPGSPFDLVFARFVLFHQRDQVTVLRKLWSIVKPGGSLVVMDADVLAPFNVWPSWAVPIRDLGRSTLQAAGLDLETGRRMPERFVDAGIGEADGLDASTLLFKASAVADFVITATTSLLPVALQMGLTTREAFHEMAASAREGAATDRSWLYWPFAIATWKKKI